MSFLSEDSSSEESDNCPDKRILSEIDGGIIESDEDFECDEPVPQDAESISAKDCSASSTGSARKHTVPANGKSKKKKEKLMINWNGKRTLQ